MIKEVFNKGNLFYNVTIKSRPKVIILNYGKLGNNGRTKTNKYTGNEKEIYHIKYNPPRKEGKDDVTGEPLIIRDDDIKETILQRLVTYHQQTEPLVSFYSDWSKENINKKPVFVAIDGTESPDEIKNNINKQLT